MDLEQTLTKWTLSGTQIKRRGMKRALSRPNLIENYTKWALSEPTLSQNLTKSALSGLKSGQVGTIGGGSCPRVDIVRKVAIWCGSGAYSRKKWSYCVGVVRVDVTTPTPYGCFFQKCVPLQHHMATFVEMGRFLTHYRQVKIVILCGRVDKNQRGKWTIHRLVNRTRR